MRESLRRNAVYRREVRLGPPRHWWRRHTVHCLLFAFGIGYLSFAEVMLSLLGPGWGKAQSDVLTQLLVLSFLLIAPVHLSLSLRRDMSTGEAASILVTRLGPQGYLWGKFQGALRPSLIIVPALWLRWALMELRDATVLSQWVELGAGSMVVMHLASGSINFLVGALLWILGAMFYTALAMHLTIRGRSQGEVLLFTVALAVAVDIALPVGAVNLWQTLSPRAGDWFLGGLAVTSLLLIVAKYAGYRWLFDLSAERIETP